MKDKYADIIDLPHPTSKKHPRMSLENRAAQLSPFAALTGYEEAVRETARLTDRRIELDESEKAEIDEKLRILNGQRDPNIKMIVTYFQPDEKKNGGAYVTRSGKLQKIKEHERLLILTDGTQIAVDEIAALIIEHEDFD